VNNRPATVKHYRMDVRLYLVPALGKLRLRDVTVKAVQMTLNGLTARGLGPATVEHCRATLRVALQHALKEGLMMQNPAMLVRTPKLQSAQIAALTPADARAIVAAFEGHPLGPLVTLSLATGLRQGELLGLGWDDVDLDAGTLAVRQQLQRADGAYALAPLKTERSRRTLALPPVAVDNLRAHKARQNAERLRLGAYRQNTGRIFTTAAGDFLNGSAVTHAFQKQLKAAGLPPLKWHGLRHGCASLMIAEGKDTRRIMEQLGHSQISVAANTYSHISAALMHDTASALQRALTGAG
jgi:integrase